MNNNKHQTYTKITKILLVKVFWALIILISTGQHADAQLRKVNEKQKKSMVQKGKQKKQKEKSFKARRKRHVRLQTDEVQDRMKNSRKKADKFNKRGKKTSVGEWWRKRKIKK